MKTSYRQRVLSTKLTWLKTYACIAALLLIPSIGVGQSSTNCNNSIKPYKAEYKGSSHGIKGTLTRRLKKQANGEWLLTNNAKVLFLDFKEESQFSLKKNKIVPNSYAYKNPVSSSKSSDINFDWQNNKAVDQQRDNAIFNLQPDILDRLSVLTQARIDLMNNCGQYNKQTYTILDDGKFKDYIVEKQSEETIATPLGKLKTIVLKQYRDDKDKYNLLWFAKDKSYLLVKIAVIEDGKTETMLISDTSL